MRPYTLYILDFLVCNIYILFSFTFCWIIFFYNKDLIFLFEVWPVVSVLPQKRFIATQLTNLFNITWILCTSLSSLFVFPLFTYNVYLFFISSWYKYQIKFYKVSLVIFTKTFYIVYYFFQLVFLPYIITFFLLWEILNDYSLLKIEAEISLFFYVKWIFTLKLCITFFISLLFYLITFLFFTYNSLHLYVLIKNQKKKFWFTLICISLFFIPPDILTQLILTLVIFLLIECFFLFSCLKLFFNIKKQ